MQILFINIIKHICQGIRSKETTDRLLKNGRQINTITGCPRCGALLAQAQARQDFRAEAT